MGLDGFRVESLLEADSFGCEALDNEVMQLGLILYPPERFNEKLLIKMRECVLKLKDAHPVKRWLKWVSKVPPVSKKDQETINFLNEVLNSRYNLITDVSVKNKIIEVLIEVPSEKLSEKILRSYLYLMIGNVTHSDNILRDIIRLPPFQNWQNFDARQSLFERISIENLEQIFLKLSRHPSDRKTYDLLLRYLKEFFNEKELLSKLSANEVNAMEGKWGLRAIEKISPDFIHYLQLQRLSSGKRQERIQQRKYPLSFQSHWIWYFNEFLTAKNSGVMEELSKIKEQNPLWFIYLMEDEQLSDFFSQKGGSSSMASRRQLARNSLKQREQFMLSLFKLIEFGDIDAGVVEDTARFFTHE